MYSKIIEKIITASKFGKSVHQHLEKHKIFMLLKKKICIKIQELVSGATFHPPCTLKFNLIKTQRHHNKENMCFLPCRHKLSLVRGGAPLPPLLPEPLKSDVHYPTQPDR